MNDFKDKVAIVTGAASGIGRAIAEELSRRSATVTLADINEEGARQIAEAINSQGGRARAAGLDVSSAEDVERIVRETVSEHGRLDYIFNNAGIGVGGEVYEIDLDHWRRITDINLLGVVYGTQAAYRVMIEQGSGHIINTASLAGLIPSPGMTPYSMTKHAVVGLSTALRAEAASFGVRVSVVCPGFVQSGIYEAATMINMEREKFLENIPFRLVEAERAAQIILRGVARNKGVIVFPFYARLFWWLHRLHPGLLSPLARKTLKDFRSSRVKP
jgi:NAD(P)-dependent dehydrogenase (short-subunit alcohol dehydrogenase family)